MAEQRVEWGTGDPIISVVGERFCNPNRTELVVKKKVEKQSNDHYDVFDVSGNLLFQVDGDKWDPERKRVMRDAAGFTVCTLRQKVFSFRENWKVYEGEKCESESLLFSARQSWSLKTSVDVFLPPNSTKKVADFHVSGNYTNASFKVFKDDSLLAEVENKLTLGSLFKENYSFTVMVNPEVDYAFIVALVVIIDDNRNAPKV